MKIITGLKDWFWGAPVQEDLVWRHEWKYPISVDDLIVIRENIRRVGRVDSHAIKTGGRYRIRSLYFDNGADDALYEKVEGINYREKYRIRLYNNNPKFIHLERKTKRNGLGIKDSAELSEQEVRDLLLNRLGWMKAEWDAALEDAAHNGCITDQASIFVKGSTRRIVVELYQKMRLEGLCPKIIVDYMREPYVFDPGNVRVTFDYDLRFSNACRNFLDPDCMLAPAGDIPLLMEVKWDRFLPDVIQSAIGACGLYPSAFSKYAQCRMCE